MLGPPKKSESAALEVPAVRRERRDGDMPCGAATLEAGAMGAGKALLADPSLGHRGDSWRKGHDQLPSSSSKLFLSGLKSELWLWSHFPDSVPSLAPALPAALRPPSS